MKKISVFKKRVKSKDSLINFHKEFLNSLVLYIEKYKVALTDISKITTLSVSTLKRFLKNNHMREESYRKLLKLGDDYINNVQTNLMYTLAEMESKVKSRVMRPSLNYVGDRFLY